MQSCICSVSLKTLHDRSLYPGHLRMDAWSSKSFSDLEDEKIWSRRWVAIGYTAQLPNAGDILPYTVGNHGIHVERNENGALSGRFNFAQHGGCRTVPLQCQTGRKTKCSYLSCGFSRDRTEGFPTSINREDVRTRHFIGFNNAKLLPVRVKLCGSIIFVNIDPTNEDSWENPSLPRLDGAVAASTQEFSCNWKLLWREVLSKFRTMSTTCGALLHGQQNSSQISCLTAILPNFLLLESKQSRLSIILQPTGIDLTLVRFASWHSSQSAQSLIDLVTTCAERATKQQIQTQSGIYEPRDVTDNLDRELMFWLTKQLGDAGNYQDTNSIMKPL